MTSDAKKAETDRELLERAARAAGIGGAWQTFGYSQEGWLDADGNAWNPLERDGDALRLAVKLDIDVFYQTDDDGRFTSAEGRSFAYVHHGSDPYAATRLAIVRCAAALASASPSDPLERANAVREGMR